MDTQPKNCTLIQSVEEFDKFVNKFDNVVCHFSEDDHPYSEAMDALFEPLAEMHPETCFLKVDAANSHDLVTKLNVTQLPTIALVKAAKVVSLMVVTEALAQFEGFSAVELATLFAEHDVLVLDPILEGPEVVLWPMEEDDDWL